MTTRTALIVAGVGVAVALWFYLRAPSPPASDPIVLPAAPATPATASLAPEYVIGGSRTPGIDMAGFRQRSPGRFF